MNSVPALFDIVEVIELSDYFGKNDSYYHSHRTYYEGELERYNLLLHIDQESTKQGKRLLRPVPLYAYFEDY
jgi:hypothetical protein